jgi:hypothetical protein
MLNLICLQCLFDCVFQNKTYVGGNLKKIRADDI